MSRDRISFALLLCGACIAVALGWFLLPTGRSAPDRTGIETSLDPGLSQEARGLHNGRQLEAGERTADLSGSEPRSEIQLAATASLLVCQTLDAEGELEVVDTVPIEFAVNGAADSAAERSAYADKPGLHWVAVREGYAPKCHQWSVAEPKVDRVELAQPGNSVEIVVVDGDGRPVQGVRVAIGAFGRFVRLRGRYLWSDISDESGRARVTDLPKGVLPLRIVSGALPRRSYMYAARVPSAEPILVEVHRAKALELEVRGLGATSARLVCRSDSDPNWSDALQLSGDIAEVVVPLTAKHMDIGLLDPLVGEVAVLSTHSVREWLEPAYVHIPPLAQVTITARALNGPCEMFAIVAQPRSSSSDRYNFEMAEHRFVPRIFGEYANGTCRLDGVLPGARAIAVIPVAPDLARTEFREVRIPDVGISVEFEVPPARELIVSVVDGLGMRVPGAKIEVVAAPARAERAIRGRFSDARGSDRRERRSEAEVLLIGRGVTDENGIATFRLRDDRVGVVVRCVGFVPAFVESLEWPWRPVHIVLSRGGELAIHSRARWKKDFRVLLTCVSEYWPDRTIQIDGDVWPVTVDGLGQGRWRVFLVYDRVKVCLVAEVNLNAQDEVVVSLPDEWNEVSTIRGLAMHKGDPLKGVLLTCWPMGSRPWKDRGIGATANDDGYFEISIPKAMRFIVGAQSRDGAGDADMLYAVSDVSATYGRSVWEFYAIEARYRVMGGGQALAKQEIELVYQGTIRGTVMSDEDGLIVVRNGMRIPPYGLVLRSAEMRELEMEVHPIEVSSAGLDVEVVELR